MSTHSVCVRCPTGYIEDNNDKLSDFSLLPKLVPNGTTNAPYLNDIDADLHMPLEQNFQYYTSHKFHDNHHIKDCFSTKSFSVLNCNIRSLSANFNTLAQMLSELYFSFSIIGLTEIKIRKNEAPITNIDIPGYHFISQPSNSNAGGVGFYIKNGFRAKIREDLSSQTDEYEALWIEIINNSERNLL